MFHKVTVEGVTGDNLEVTPTLEEQNFNGVYTSVSVDAIEGEEITITPSEEDQFADGVYTKVTVLGVPTPEFNANIVPQATFTVTTAVTEIGDLDCLNVTSMRSGFAGCENLTSINLKNTSHLSDLYYLFNGCKKLIKFNENNELDCSSATDLGYLFAGCENLTSIKLKNTSNASNIGNICKTCKSLVSFEIDDTSKVDSMSSAFASCKALKEITLDCPNVTSMASMFEENTGIEKITLTNTSKVKNMSRMFGMGWGNTPKLKTISQLDASSCTNLSSTFMSCAALTDFGGLINIGKGYTQASNNYSSYKIDLSACTLLTHDSLMNVINGLYDLNLTYNVAGGGTLYTQTLKLGSTNLAKLTADEIAIATNKGWNVS